MAEQHFCTRARVINVVVGDESQKPIPSLNLCRDCNASQLVQKGKLISLVIEGTKTELREVGPQFIKRFVAVPQY